MITTLFFVNSLIIFQSVQNSELTCHIVCASMPRLGLTLNLGEYRRMSVLGLI